ncbi:hypothetical protein AXF42_Ash004659 [Apostasia shenzhenica]|uniref:Uncharacterized protein n=1 Tax=Apostasia shenzhenica TaxID=1088818 RepID=A0A2I0BH83_9ASPA|nr:hypothetical protein AXF42_Ash004659 [Apostasia shenzhenica]
MDSRSFRGLLSNRRPPRARLSCLGGTPGMRKFVLHALSYVVVQRHRRTGLFPRSRMAFSTDQQVFIESRNLRGCRQAHALMCVTTIGGACYIRIHAAASRTYTWRLMWH